ncbi:cupin domain-containing protein [Congregibacter sp.]|nr:cupin domain-containing protein [Congregibacter sp.]MDA8962134.1 cupin domain-containing protein [Congregibacter sp.]
MWLYRTANVLVGLFVCLPVILTAEPLQKHASVETLVKSSNMWNGQRLPPYGEGQPEITILKFEIPPGGQLPLHLHPYANAGVLLSGELTVHSEGGQTERLIAGEPLIELVNIPHYGANEGDVPAVILVFYAGIAGQAVTHLLE